MKTIALVFDFDDTLVPDSFSALLRHFGLNETRFWEEEVKELVKQGFDPTLAYLNKFMSYIGPEKPMGLLSNAQLKDFGATLDAHFYPGLESFFQEIRELVKGVSADLQVEFYIVSGGIQDLILGSKLVAKNFTGVYGCRLAEDPESGALSSIKRCVTFTEKTRYLFEINKGIQPLDSEHDPYIVNKNIPSSKRRIPFKNMIYVGDGLTDIPCFSMLKKHGGMSFGIFDPGREHSARRALTEFLHTNRVVSMHAPRYNRTDELGSLLRAAVMTCASKVKLLESEAESE